MVSESFVIEPMTETDLPAVAGVENASAPAPWTDKQFRDELGKPHSFFWVARVSNRPVAFGGFWRVAEEAQIANIAVHPAWRRRGLGRRLLREMAAAARSRGARVMNLEVRAGNAAALGLYRTEGFRETARRPRYYDGAEDALLMEKDL